MNRAETLAAAVHAAWSAVSLHLGEDPVSWEQAPEWRKSALHHTIGFWESWHQYESLEMTSFCAATHLTWVRFHQRHNWTYSDLTPYAALPMDQQLKLVAMLRAYLFTRGLIENRVFTA